MKRKDLFDEYELYMTANHYKTKSDKTNFYSKLENVGIVAKKSNGAEMYASMTAKELLDLATKNKWMHESDDFDVPANPKDELKENEHLIAELMEKNKLLKLKIEEEKKTKVVVKETPKEEPVVEKPKKVQISTDALDKATKIKPMENAFCKKKSYYEEKAKNIFKEYIHDDDFAKKLVE